MKERSYLSHLISFSDKVNHLMDEGKAVHAVLLDFNNVFDTVPQNILERLSSWVKQVHAALGDELAWQ